MKIAYLALLLTLTSCASTNVVRPVKSAYAPKNYTPKGVVKYLNQGADFVIESRREDAFKEMYSGCGGNYKITGEGPREEGGVVSQISPGSAMFFSSQYWYISYECS